MIPIGTVRLASAVMDVARLTLMPETQKALARDGDVCRATLGRSAMAGLLAGAGAVGLVVLPAALLTVVVARRYDSRIADGAPTMPRWLRIAIGLCFVAPPMVAR